MGNWIQGAIKNKGGLHKALGISQGKKIPASKLKKKKGDSTHMMRMKNLARTLAKMHGG
jgi:hypothetical protein